MPDAVLDQPTTGSDNGQPPAQSPGWLAGLPADLRDNEAFKSHRTVGDFAKAHLATAEKAKSLEARLSNSIPRLSENATQEERDVYFNSLGRPEKAEGYEFAEDKANPETMLPWKKDFHELGLTKAQAKGLKDKWDARLNALVDKHNADIQKMNTEAESKLKAEWGDKYEANVQLAQRFWKKETDSELDKVFEGASQAQRLGVARFIFRMAAKTGEDTSLPGSGQRPSQSGPAALTYEKSNMPPARRR